MLGYKDILPYQNDVIDRMFEQDKTLALIAMGGGKTVMAGTAAVELIEHKVINRWLVLATKRIAQLVWPPEFQKWEHLRDTEVAAATGALSDVERMKVIEGEAPIVVVNYELLPWLFDTYGADLFEMFGFDGLIIDEITKLKNSKGVRFKKLSKWLRRFKIRIGMTGNFTSKGLLDVYGQVFLIDDGKRLGKGFNRFQGRYFEKTGPMPWQWEQYDDSLDRVLDDIHDICIQIPDSVYVDQLPELVAVPIIVELPKDQRAHYDELEKHFVEEFSGEEIMVSNSGVLSGKLQQLANGFIYDEDKNIIRTHDEKLDALEELVDSLQGEPLLVAYKFKADLVMIQERFGKLPYLGAGVSDKNAAQYERDWNAGKLPLFLLHPMSAAHGLNLQDGGNKVCWYGLTWSNEEHDQLIARLRRKGQLASQVWSYYIETADTVDQDVHTAAIEKARIDRAISAGIRARNG